jgi:hypothetical protein
LGSSTVWNLDNHVSIVDQVKSSVVWELRSNVEVSFNIESKLFVELTLSWLLLVLINIDNLPSLVDLAVLVFNNNVSILIVESSLNSNDLSFLILDESISVSEELPPS